MLDFRLAGAAINTLLNNLTNEPEVDRFKTYTTIVDLLDDMAEHSSNSGIRDEFIEQKFLELRVYLTHATGLRKTGDSTEQNITNAVLTLESLIKGLNQLNLDPEHK